MVDRRLDEKNASHSTHNEQKKNIKEAIRHNLNSFCHDGSSLYHTYRWTDVDEDVPPSVCPKLDPVSVSCCLPVRVVCDVTNNKKRTRFELSESLIFSQQRRTGASVCERDTPHFWDESVLLFGTTPTRCCPHMQVQVSQQTNPGTFFTTRVRLPL